MKLIRNMLSATKIPDDPLDKGPREELQELEQFLTQLEKCGKKIENGMKDATEGIRDLGVAVSGFHGEKSRYRSCVEEVVEGMRIWEDERLRMIEQCGVIQQLVVAMAGQLKST
eukprot:Filipodium_phascolosomae@DN2778_c0_g1_i1.p1